MNALTDRLRINLCLAVVATYLIFNAGIMLVRVPIAGPLAMPIGQMLMVVFIIYFVKDTPYFKDFMKGRYFWPLLFWWVYGLIHVVLGVQKDGVWALRDATHLIESLFAWIGFVVASRIDDINRIFRWAGVVLIIACFYSLLYPYREELQAISPKVQALAGYAAPVFFVFWNTGLLVLTASAHLVLGEGKLLAVGRDILFTIIVAYVIMAFQTRTIYLQAIALVALLIWYRPSLAGSVAKMAGIVALALLSLPLLGVALEGRLGGGVSLDFVWRHFLSSFAIESTQLEGAAQGVTLRFGWWERIYDRMVSDLANLFFGLGFGVPLTDFRINNVIVVREPHNSFISIVSRLGLVGFAAFIVVKVHFFSTLIRLIRWFKANDLEHGARKLFLCLLYFVFVLIGSMGEDELEKPYTAIPYYFLWGVVMFIALKVKEEARSETQTETAKMQAPASNAPSS